MDSSKKTVVVVGGGFGGISVAKQLKKANVNVILVDKKNHHLFQPLLYQVATAALSPGDIAMPIRGIFGKYSNVRTVMDEVTEIDKNSQTIVLKSGNKLNYDYLVLAPGAQYNYFGNDNWSEHAPGLKTIANALEVREKILVSLEKADQIPDKEKRKPYLRYVIVGGGPTGVEMAGAIAEIAKRNMMRDFKSLSPEETEVYLVEAMSGILNGYPEHLSKKAQKDLEKMGVQILLDSPVTDIRENGIEIDGKFIETPNMVWAAGVKASPLIKALDCEIDKMGRAIVTKNLTIPGTGNIFVIGDAAHAKDEDGNPLPGLAPVALQMGKYVGNLIKEGKSIDKVNPFHYTDKGTMATIGRAKAVAKIRGFTFSGFVAWLVWCFIHIFFLIGYRNRFRVFAEWSWYYLTFKRGVRLITGRVTKK
ncbi:NAD(P)/FAD-dependent oxidoreductase [Rhodohalobacter sp. 614A]|uniref:NAD(P)/FAD-dependent oxidoreductase n=1 Tax=Rhodohalobacter sp. 614A TaxID=2908649 RepID=UPI001F2EC938|nr:NAD(P)/FAD-dependent oxidoreductase [Rhodohalobacter sp. 614A]